MPRCACAGPSSRRVPASAPSSEAPFYPTEQHKSFAALQVTPITRLMVMMVVAPAGCEGRSRREFGCPCHLASRSICQPAMTTSARRTTTPGPAGRWCGCRGNEKGSSEVGPPVCAAPHDVMRVPFFCSGSSPPVARVAFGSKRRMADPDASPTRRPGVAILLGTLCRRCRRAAAIACGNIGIAEHLQGASRLRAGCLRQYIAMVVRGTVWVPAAFVTQLLHCCALPAR